MHPHNLGHILVKIHLSIPDFMLYMAAMILYLNVFTLLSLPVVPKTSIFINPQKRKSSMLNGSRRPWNKANCYAPKAIMEDLQPLGPLVSRWICYTVVIPRMWVSCTNSNSLPELRNAESGMSPYGNTGLPLCSIM
jgi:hypothetical protein